MFDWTYEELPQPTAGLASLQSNIDEFGYCLVKDAITPEQLTAAKRRLLEQAQAELEGGPGIRRRRRQAAVGRFH